VRAGVYILAAVLILAGLLLDASYQRLTPEAQHAEATVVDFERRHPKQVYPIFAFADADGKQYRVTNPTQQGLFRFTAGDKVAIAYSRTDPQKARIDTVWFTHRWLMAGVFVTLTLIFGHAFSTRAPKDD
jgi:hypothetical protein